MTGHDGSPTLERLIGDARTRREELHSFIERLRRDHHEWAERAESLPRRERLTAAQRQLFRVHLTRYKSRARP
jgi:FtsZ-binding cell division protein ZapB